MPDGAGSDAVPRPGVEPPGRAGAIHIARAEARAGRGAAAGAAAIAESGEDDRTGPAQPVAPGASPDDGLTGLSQRIDAIARRLSKISESVQFTEAFVSVGLAERISSLVTEELAVRKRLLAEQARTGRRFRFAVASLVVMAALLVAEMQGDYLSAAVAAIGGDGPRHVAPSLSRAGARIAVLAGPPGPW